MNVKHRLTQFIDFKGLSNRAFSEKISASPSYFTTTKSIGSDFLEKIHAAFPEINMDWVITGRGEMLYTEAKESNEVPPVPMDESVEYIRQIVRKEIAAILNAQEKTDDVEAY